MSKHCIICHRELPKGTKLSLCKYHRDKGKENGAKAVGTVAGVALAGFGIVTKVGIEGVKKAGPTVAKAVRMVIKH